MFSVPSLPSENRSERLGEFESRSVKPRDAVEGFHLLLLENSHKLCRKACVYFNFVHETVNSHNLKTANHIT